MNGKMLSAVGNRYKYVVAELPPISGNGCLLSYARYGMCVPKTPYSANFLHSLCEELFLMRRSTKISIGVTTVVIVVAAVI